MSDGVALALTLALVAVAVMLGMFTLQTRPVVSTPEPGRPRRICVP